MHGLYVTKLQVEKDAIESPLYRSSSSLKQIKRRDIFYNALYQESIRELKPSCG